MIINLQIVLLLQNAEYIVSEDAHFVYWPHGSQNKSGRLG